MNDIIVVGVSDSKISKSPNTLATYALGSCIGTALFDSRSGIGGISHVMLPESSILNNKTNFNRMKFADTAIVDIIEKMVQLGAVRGNISAKIAGGANMFDSFDYSAGSPLRKIGERNIAGIKKSLNQLGIPIIGEDTGANYGRTMFLDLDTGRVRIKSVGKEIKEL